MSIFSYLRSPDFMRRCVSNFDQVGDFHTKFGLPRQDAHKPPAFPPSDVISFRLRFLEEEMTELRAACSAGNLPEVADALADLVYVALGTAHVFSIPFDDVFNEVQRTNMLKQRATSAAHSKRKHAQDVVKPPGWRKPDISGILRRFGWEER